MPAAPLTAVIWSARASVLDMDENLLSFLLRLLTVVVYAGLLACGAWLGFFFAPAGWENAGALAGGFIAVASAAVAAWRDTTSSGRRIFRS